MSNQKRGFDSLNGSSNITSSRTFRKVLITALVVVLIVLAILFFKKVHFYSDWMQSPASCRSPGVEYRVCGLCGVTETHKLAEKSPHSYGEWSVVSEPTAVLFGEQVRYCSECGYKDSETVMPFSVLPKLFLTGHGTFTETEPIALTGNYVDQDLSEEFTMQFTLDPYSDRVDKRMYLMRSITPVRGDSFTKLLGVETSSYLLIGGLDDSTAGRAPAASKLWQDVLSQSETQVLTGANKGAMSAKTILLYVNGDFYGVYALSLPLSGETVFGSSDGSTSGKRAVLYMRYENDAAAFHTTAAPYSAQFVWSDNGEQGWVYQSFNDMVNFITSNRDATLTGGIGRYLDVSTTVDYLLTSYLLGAGDNLVSNVAWCTADGHTWRPLLVYPSKCLGLASSSALPQYTNNGAAYRAEGLKSELWDKLLLYYPRTIRREYARLRQSVFSSDALAVWTDTYFDIAEAETYAADAVAYPTLKNAKFGSKTLIDGWLKDRLAAMDRTFGG